MKFIPLRDLKKGTYQAQVTNCIETKSQNDNEMLKVTITIWDTDGQKHSMNDNLFGFKLKNFCDVANLNDAYETGEVTIAQVIGKECLVSVDEESYINKEGSTVKATKIKKYLAQPANAIVDDAIEF